MNGKLVMALRIGFGVFCMIFGINKFIEFLPPFPLEGEAGTLFQIYFDSGFLKLIGAFEVIFGLLLVLKKYVGLALIWLVAIMFNALLFHLFHDPATIGGAVLGLALALANVYFHKDYFSKVLSM